MHLPVGSHIWVRIAYRDPNRLILKAYHFAPDPAAPGGVSVAPISYLVADSLMRHPAGVISYRYVEDLDAIEDVHRLPKTDPTARLVRYMGVAMHGDPAAFYREHIA